MSNDNQTRGLELFKLAAAGLLALSTIGAAVAVGTPANETIRNIASATYFDVNGNEYGVDSPESTIQVAAVYSANILQDESTSGAPGTTVYFPHLLSNTGNATDIIHVCGSDYLAGVIGVDDDDASTACANWQIHQDGVINGAGNGQPDPGEQRISVGDDDGVCTEENTITLPADSHVNLVISCSIPIGAAANAVIGVTITAQAEQGTGNQLVGSVFDYTDGVDGGTNGRDGQDDTNNDIVTVTFDASLTESKSATYDDNSTPNNHDDDSVEYVLTIGNNGGSAATNVFVYDFLDPRTHDVDPNGDGIDADDLLQVQDLVAPGSTAFQIIPVDVGQDLTTLVDASDIFPGGVTMPDAVARTNPFGAPTLAIVVYYASIPQANTRNITFGIDTVDGLLPQTVDVLDRIDNTFNTVSAETPDDRSNETQLSVDSIYGGAIGDTGIGASLGVNDGGDDDATDGEDDEDLADTQFVDVAPNGAMVLFRNEITNDGTVADCFTIRVVGGADGQAIADNYLTDDARLDADSATGFPAGTAFSVYDATNSNQVVGNCGGEVGVNLIPGQTLTVVIRAGLPSTYFGTNNLVATTIINSTGAIAASLHTAVTGTTPGITSGPTSGVGTGPNDTEYWDVKAELLGAVAPPAGDLSNDSADGNSAENKHPVPLENIRINGNDALSPTTTLGGAIGGTVDFTLVVQNDSGQNDTFQLTSGSALQAISEAASASPGSPSADTTLAALLPGWSVQFLDSGNSPASSTISLGPNSFQVITARVTVPSLASQALYNHDLAALTAEGSDVNGSGSQAGSSVGISANDVVGGDDGAGDYAIFFRIQSLASGATDIKLDSVQVAETELVVLTEDNNGTVQPGGTIEYAHQLINQGNTDEIVHLYTDQSGNADGWNHIILVPVAVGGDANTTTLVPLAGLIDGGFVVIVDPVLGPIQVAVTAPQTPDLGGGDDTYVGIPLISGQYIDLVDRVNAPTNAPDGYTDTVTIGGVYDFGDDNDPVAERTDITNVQLGQVRLIKTNAVDHDCDGDVSSEFVDATGVRGVPGSDIEPGFLPTGASNIFRVDNLAQVQPGECVIWRIVAKNEGAAVLTDLVITDASPDFTSYISGTMSTCVGGPTDATCTADADYFEFAAAAEDGVTGNGTTPAHFALTTFTAGGTVLATDPVTSTNEADFRFFVGQADVGDLDADRALEGGDLAPNQEVSIRFSTRVE
jgi:uncharacterized repeat protein (TIGR01451 family)